VRLSPLLSDCSTTESTVGVRVYRSTPTVGFCTMCRRHTAIRYRRPQRGWKPGASDFPQL